MTSVCKYMTLTAAGVSKIPTLCRPDDDMETLSDSETYNIDEDNVAVVEARRQIDRVFGLISDVASVTSAASNNALADTPVTVASFAIRCRVNCKVFSFGRVEIRLIFFQMF